MVELSKILEVMEEWENINEEMCTNCGEQGTMEVIILKAFVLEEKDYMDVAIRQCKDCGHISSIGSRGLFGM